jgi:hypothetical protein
MSGQAKAAGMSDTFFTASPHWAWWIIFYFFIGGIAGTAFLLSSILHLTGRPSDRQSAPDRPLIHLGYYVALLGTVVSGILLTLDLDRGLTQRGAQRTTGQVHELHGLDQQHATNRLWTADVEQRGPVADASLAGQVPSVCEQIHHPEPDIVPGQPVPFAGVAEAADHLHRGPMVAVDPTAHDSRVRCVRPRMAQPLGG